MSREAITTMLQKVRISVIGFLLLALSLSLTQTAKACHYASGEIFATYIGNTLDVCTGTTGYKYRVNLALYFACQTCTLNDRDSIQFTIRSAQTGLLDNPDPNANGWWLMETAYDTVSQTCPNFRYKNSCNDLTRRDSFPAYKQILFQQDVTLPSAQPDWVFALNSGSARANTNNANSGYFYIETVVNNLSRATASTPRFTSNPIFVSCVNERASILNTPHDIDGDSLVVSHYQPMSAPGIPVPFNPGYDLVNYIDTDPSGPFTVNARTGAASFIPNTSGMYQLAFRVDKYERGTGIFLGSSQREINMAVLPCAEAPPEIDSMPSTIITGGRLTTTPDGGSIIYTCPGSQLTFSMGAKGSAPNGNIYMSANIGRMQGSVFMITGNGTLSPTGTFIWTPTVSDIGDHTLIITAKDSTCSGSPGSQTIQSTQTAYTLRVLPGIDLGPDIPICAVGRKPAQLYVKGGEHLKLQWEEYINGVKSPTPVYLNNPNIHNPVARLQSTANSSVVMYRVTTPDLQGSTCKFVDSLIFYPDPSSRLELFPAETVVLCQPDFVQIEALFKGDQPVGNLPCGANGPLIQCSDPRSVEVYAPPAYGMSTAYDSLGSLTPVFTNTTQTSKYEYIIPKSELNAYGMTGGTLKSIAFEVAASPVPGNTHPYENFTIRIGCTNRQQLLADSGFTRDADLEVVYTGKSPYLFGAGTHTFQFDKGYNRDTAMGLIVQICYSNATAVTNCTGSLGSAPILRFVPTPYTSGLVLTSRVPGTTTVCGLVGSDSIVAKTARPKFRFAYCEAPPDKLTFRWNPAAQSSDSTIARQVPYVQATTKFMVETYGRNGCLLQDSVVVYVPGNHYTVQPSDTTICSGTEARLDINGGFQYKWYEYTEPNGYTPATTLDCNSCKTVLARPLQNTHYTIAVYDSVFCVDTIDVRIKVKPATEADCDLPDSSSSANQITIPNVFSPGSSANGVFKIIEINDAKLKKFTIFNRWGQKMFESSNINEGWDGRYKGEPQPIGVYIYSIEAESPAGEKIVEQGNVTLIK